MSNTIVIGPVRFSYLNCFEARAVKEGDDKKFSVSCIIPKKDKAQIRKINAAIEEAKELGKDKKWGGRIPKNLKLPVRDGDVDRDEDENYAKSWFLTANSSIKPGVVDANREPIIDKDEIYSGAYGYVNVTFYPFNTNGNKGIGISFNHIMKTKDGERLAGGVSLESAFDEVEVEEEEDEDEVPAPKKKRSLKSLL